jgi:hypothetical protein
MAFSVDMNVSTVREILKGIHSTQLKTLKLYQTHPRSEQQCLRTCRSSCLPSVADPLGHWLSEKFHLHPRILEGLVLFISFRSNRNPPYINFLLFPGLYIEARQVQTHARRSSFLPAFLTPALSFAKVNPLRLRLPRSAILYLPWRRIVQRSCFLQWSSVAPAYSCPFPV